MKGYNAILAGNSPKATSWEYLATDAVGNFIEFWGFKRNHGRVWTLLYLRGEALPASQIQQVLNLSKGAVSMIMRELERWGVVYRIRSPNTNAWHFIAETDLMGMVGRVIKERETNLIIRIKTDLQEAITIARKSSNASTETIDRISRLITLATMAETAIGLFVRTAQVDVTKAIKILGQPIVPLWRGKK